MTRISKLYTTKEFAAEARVDPATIRRWVETGKIKPTAMTLGGHYRFDEESVRTYLGLTETSAEAPTALAEVQ